MDMTLKIRIFLGILGSFLFFVHPGFSQTLPGGFSHLFVAGPLNSPTALAFTPDGRLFVTEQTGAVRVIKNGVLLSQPFATLNVNATSERGLNGIAIDPDFNSNHFVYFYYTVSSGVNNRVSRMTANGDVALAGSEIVLLELDPLSPGSAFHNGGSLQFGIDGKLLIGVGDNGVTATSQNLDTNLGKVIRINSDGSIPTDNPYPTGSLQRKTVWASGLRNPFSLAVQPTTGRIFVNDVGAATWEEINECTLGGKNLGWPLFEGAGGTAGYTDPLYSYHHGTNPGEGCAISGGIFFNPTSTNYPPQYIGRYFFIDYCGFWIDTLILNGSTATRENFASAIGAYPVNLAVSPDGELYYLSRGIGQVYKIIYSVTGAPMITAQPQSISITQGASLTFSVTATGTAPLQFQWKKAGVNISGANTPNYTIASVAPSDAGTYSVLVSNGFGNVQSADATLVVTGVNQSPTGTITKPLVGATYAAGKTIPFAGTGTDPEEGTLPASAFAWSVTFHHDTHTHPGPSVPAGVENGSFVIPNIGETSSNVFYRIQLTVTDSQGAQHTSHRDLYPRTSLITLNTQPQGMQLTLDGQPVTAPLTLTSVEGMKRTLGILSPQGLFSFSSWSQGGSVTQTITTNVDDKIYTARFLALVPPTDDSYVRSGSFSGANFGAATTVAIREATPSSGQQRLAYLKFNLSGLSANISSAVLRLYGKVSGTVASPVFLEAHEVQDFSWLESTLNFSNAPTGLVPILATQTFTTVTNQYYDLDLTAFITGKLGAGQNELSLLLKSPSPTTNFIQFNSKEASTKGPSLLITPL